MKRDFLTTAFERIRGRMTRMGTADEYSDDLQDAFCRLWSRKDSIADTSHAEGMLTMTARNIHVDNLRHSSRYPSVNMEDAGPIPDTETETDNTTELYNEIERIISGHLSERDRKNHIGILQDHHLRPLPDHHTIKRHRMGRSFPVAGGKHT